MNDPTKQHINGDAGWLGVNLRNDPATLPPGLMADAENMRFRNGLPETRRGCVKPHWAHAVNPSTPTVVPAWGIIYGVGVFKDPDSLEWVLIAADGRIYRTREHNTPAALTLPSGVGIWSDCFPAQAFNKVYLFRGRYLAPLVMSDLSAGFADLLPLWSAATQYATGAEIAYGPFTAITSITSVSTTATVITTAAHGYVTGADVTISGAVETEYNGRYNITVIDVTTFTYAFAGSATTPATGTKTCSNMAQYWAAGATSYTLTALVRVVNTVTATKTAHGLANGTSVVIAGATQAEFNGTFVISNVTANTFDYTVTAVSSYPILAGVGITRAGTTATATKAAHGFTNGQSVTIAGATQPEYNGTYVIANVTVNTWDYTIVGAPATPATGAPTAQCASATGTLTLTAQVVPASLSPDTAPTQWTRLWNILPNADDALFINNRLLVPTAYTPGALTYTTGSNYTKKDFIVATDFIDQTHFDFASEFRINQGSEDELVQLQKFGDDTVICFKGKSWGALSGVRYDLASLQLDMRGTQYGLSAPRASVVAGQDIYLLAEKRGVVSIRQTEQNALQSVDLPLSDEIQPLIERINWSLSGRARMAYWDNKLYVAVPLDDGKRLGRELARVGSIYQIINNFPPWVPDALYFSVDIVPGAKYRFTPGTNEAYGYSVAVLSTETTFTASSPHFSFVGTGPGAACTASLRQIYENVNNAVLVYDFLTQKWSGRDTGIACMVKEFFKAKYNGVERLFFVASDNYVNMVEEAYDGDQIGNTSAATGLSWNQIAHNWTSRGYASPDMRFDRPTEALLILGTQNPSYAVSLLYDGVNETQTMDADGTTTWTRSRTVYDRPFDGADWDASNVNGDHGTAYRQDYSVTIDNLNGMYLTNGVALCVYQEMVQAFTVTPKRGRAVQIKFTATQGRTQVKGIEVRALRSHKRKGSFI